MRFCSVAASIRLGKIEKRLDVLSGLLVAYINLDEVIRIVREEDDPKQVMMQRFAINEIQADAILGMRLRQLRKLEEIEIRREDERLRGERTDLLALLGDEQRRWSVISDEIGDIGKTYSPTTALGRRRTAVADGAPSIVVPVEATIEREFVTVVCSAKGWIRAITGHACEKSEIRYKDGDSAQFCFPATNTDKLIVFASNGRFYTLGCDRLPRGRGHGEPLRLMIDLPDRQKPVAIFVHSRDRRLLIGTDTGKGFLVEEAKVVAHTRSGRQVLLLGPNEEAVVCTVVEANADAVAVIGSDRKLLVFPLEEVPSMTCGRGVILQRYREGNLIDIATFALAGGLSWTAGGGTRTETNVTPWVGKRGQVGQKAPRRFPLSSRFTVKNK